MNNAFDAFVWNILFLAETCKFNKHLYIIYVLYKPQLYGRYRRAFKSYGFLHARLYRYSRKWVIVFKSLLCPTFHRLHADCEYDNLVFIKTIVCSHCRGGFEEYYSGWAHRYYCLIFHEKLLFFFSSMRNCFLAKKNIKCLKTHNNFSIKRMTINNKLKP